MKSITKLLISTGLALATTISIQPAMAQDNAEKTIQAAPTPDVNTLKPVTAEPVKMTDADPALWVVKDKDTTIYLFGTVHVLKPGLSWFDEGVKTAFDSSDQLVMEIITPDAAKAQSIFLKYALADDNKKLSERLDAETLEKYKKAMAKYGLPVAAFDPLDPWAATAALQVTALTKAGFNPASGVETVLTAAAKADGKKLGEVETMEEQLQIFENLSMPTQLTFLKETLDSMSRGTDDIDELVDAWTKGDAKKLGQIMNSGFSDKELYYKMLTKRNANWAEWINNRMDKPGTIFMAVGAGHLAGGASVQNLLKAYNIDAKRVNY